MAGIHSLKSFCIANSATATNVTLSNLGEPVKSKKGKAVTTLVMSQIGKTEKTALQKLLFEEGDKSIADQLKGAIRMARIAELNVALNQTDDAEIMDAIGEYIHGKQKIGDKLSASDKLLVKNASAIMQAKPDGCEDFKDYTFTGNIGHSTKTSVIRRSKTYYPKQLDNKEIEVKGDNAWLKYFDDVLAHEELTHGAKGETGIAELAKGKGSPTQTAASAIILAKLSGAEGNVDDLYEKMKPKPKSKKLVSLKNPLSKSSPAIGAVKESMMEQLLSIGNKDEAQITNAIIAEKKNELTKDPGQTVNPATVGPKDVTYVDIIEYMVDALKKPPTPAGVSSDATSSRAAGAERIEMDRRTSGNPGASSAPTPPRKTDQRGGLTSDGSVEQIASVYTEGSIEDIEKHLNQIPKGSFISTADTKKLMAKLPVGYDVSYEEGMSLKCCEYKGGEKYYNLGSGDDENCFAVSELSGRAQQFNNVLKNAETMADIANYLDQMPIGSKIDLDYIHEDQRQLLQKNANLESEPICITKVDDGHFQIIDEEDTEHEVVIFELCGMSNKLINAIGESPESHLTPVEVQSMIDLLLKKKIIKISADKVSYTCPNNDNFENFCALCEDGDVASAMEIFNNSLRRHSAATKIQAEERAHQIQLRSKLLDAVSGADDGFKTVFTESVNRIFQQLNGIDDSKKKKQFVTKLLEALIEEPGRIKNDFIVISGNGDVTVNKLEAAINYLLSDACNDLANGLSILKEVHYDLPEGFIFDGNATKEKINKKAAAQIDNIIANGFPKGSFTITGFFNAVVDGAKKRMNVIGPPANTDASHGNAGQTTRPQNKTPHAQSPLLYQLKRQFGIKRLGSSTNLGKTCTFAEIESFNALPGPMKEKIKSDVKQINKATKGARKLDQTWEDYGVTGWLSENDSIIYLAIDEDSGDVAGYAIMQPNGELDAITRNRSGEASRNYKGVGKELLKTIVKQTTSEGVKKFPKLSWTSRKDMSDDTCKLKEFYDGMQDIFGEAGYTYESHDDGEAGRLYQDVGYVRYALTEVASTVGQPNTQANDDDVTVASIMARLQNNPSAYLRKEFGIEFHQLSANDKQQIRTHLKETYPNEYCAYISGRFDANILGGSDQLKVRCFKQGGSISDAKLEDYVRKGVLKKEADSYYFTNEFISVDSAHELQAKLHKNVNQDDILALVEEWRNPTGTGYLHALGSYVINGKVADKIWSEVSSDGGGLPQIFENLKSELQNQGLSDVEAEQLARKVIGFVPFRDEDNQKDFLGEALLDTVTGYLNLDDGALNDQLTGLKDQVRNFDAMSNSDKESYIKKINALMWCRMYRSFHGDLDAAKKTELERILIENELSKSISDDPTKEPYSDLSMGINVIKRFLYDGFSQYTGAVAHEITHVMVAQGKSALSAFGTPYIGAASHEFLADLGAFAYFIETGDIDEMTEIESFLQMTVTEEVNDVNGLSLRETTDEHLNSRRALNFMLKKKGIDAITQAVNYLKKIIKEDCHTDLELGIDWDVDKALKSFLKKYFEQSGLTTLGFKGTNDNFITIQPTNV